MKHLFLDTNIIIDVLADRKPFSASSALLFECAENGQAQLYISALSYTNVYYIVKKVSSHKQMVALLKDLGTSVSTLDVSKQVINEALFSSWKDFEDAVQFFTAKSYNKIDAIVTRNVKDFKNNHLSIITPEEALVLIQK
jgi:predicted nucleic acid-binding protein